MTLYSMASINPRRAIAEALAHAKYSYLEAATGIGTSIDNLIEGRVALWKVMALTGATEEQMYNWGHN